MIFTIFFSFLVLQRIIELFIARKNEIWMKRRGAIEYGKEHYIFIVGIHIMFFISLIIEVTFYQKNLSSAWPILLILFLITQFARIWALMSLGRFWNTKILVLPNAKVIRKGPYRFVKHPNYLIVILEFLIIPLMFQAYITAILFSILNGIILRIRISAEEQALIELTNYKNSFQQTNRFYIPRKS